MAQRIPLPWELDNTEDVRDWRRIDPEVQRQRDREAALIRSTETDNPELAGIEDRVAEVGGQKRKKYDRVDNPLRAEAAPAARVPLPWETPAKPTNKYSKYHLPLSTDIPKERGFFDELGTQLVGGALVDLPEMTGQGLKFLERETGLETGDLGRRMVAGARERAPQYERSGQERGVAADVLLSGARGVAPVLAAAPLAFVPGVGTSAAALAAGTLFGTSSAQETYDKLIAQGVSPEEATAASRRVGLIQGAGETIATAVGAKAFKPLLKGKTTAGLVADLTDTSILNPFAKGMATNLLVQPTTEVAQDVGASLVERAYGGKAEDLYAIGKESFKGGLGLTLLLGPLSIGGHVSRSNNAATLKAALSDDLSIPPEVKQQAITAVQTAAQQKGIKDEDIADWVTKQIELEDRRNDALRRIEDAINYDVEIGDPKTLAEYDKAFNSPSGEKITEVGADGKKKTRELTIGELIQEQAKRNILGELTEEPTNLLTPSVMNAQDYLQKMRRENILGSTDPLTQVETGKQVAPGVTQTASGTYVTAPEDQVSQGLGRQMPQAAYGVPGVTTTGGGVYQINPEQLQGPAAQVQTGQRVAEPQVMGGLARPAAPVPSSGPAAVSPGVITPPGSFTPPVVAAPATPAKPAAKPKAAKVVAPVVAPAVTVTRGDEIKTTEAAKQEPIDEGLAEEIEAAINKLNATVTSEKGKAGGRVSLPQGVFKGLVRMLRSPDEVAPIVYAEKGAAVDVEATKKYGGTVRKIYDAAQRVLHTSRDLASAEANALKEQTTINAKPGAPTVAAAEIKAKATTEKITLLRQQLRNAIEGLVNASGSERNADALISVLKSKTQKRTTKPVNPKRFREVAAALKKKEDISQAEYDTILDSLISRAWRAYKDNELDTAEFADIVKSEPTRTSTEAGKAKVAQPLVSAAEGKASKPFRAVTVQKKTETAEEFAARQQEALDKYKARLEEGTGVQGLLNFFRGPNQSAYTNALATAITQALRRRGAKQPKLAWIEDGDTTTNPSYNPKTDTVLVHKTASAEETLHETLHAALQWLVHSNPNLVEVQRLAKSLDKVLAVNIDSTSLSNAQKEKAKEVVAVLNKIVNRTKNKSTAKLDAVLELMSYGTTLADFKALLKDIPSTNDAATRSWRTAVTDLWNNIVSLAQSLLGVSNTVANDVLENTISLLNKAATAEVLPTKSTGNILESALNTATAAFKNWFGNSVVRNKDGSPKVMYHGTAQDIHEFRAKQAGAIFLTDDPRFAESFTNMSEYDMIKKLFNTATPKQRNKWVMAAANRALAENNINKKMFNEIKQEFSYEGVVQDIHGREISNYGVLPVAIEPEIHDTLKDALPSRANIIPVYVSAQNPFDFENPEHIEAIRAEFSKLVREPLPAKTIQSGAWSTIESKPVQDAIRAAGFDGFYVVEGGRKNLAVYEPSQIKSVFNRGTYGRDTGNILEAAVTSNKALSQAAGIPAQDFRTFSKRIAPAALSTRFLFDAFGWSKLANKIIDSSGKISEKIRKDFPATERALIYINSKFSAGEATSQEIENFKVNKSVGYQQMERLANFVSNRSGSDVLSLFKYMDGDKTALDNVTNKEILTRAADNVLNWFDTYVKELPAADQKFFTNQKFSKSLLFASNRSQVASSTFGMRGLAKVMGLQHKYEETLDGFKQWIAKDQNGDLDLEGRFYQVFKNDPLIANTPQIEGYMSISEFEKLGRKNPTGFVVDPTREWWLSQYEADKKYKFTSSMTAKQAIDEGKADELANAMRNTMAALANNYASKNFSRATAAIGYTEDGKPTASSVAFNSLADIKEVFGRVVRDDQVLEVSSNEARTPQITSMYRRTGTWVKLSGNKEVYGDLAGKYVSGPVWSAITDMSDRQPVIPFAAYNNGMRWFKKAKTVYNPGTHITNVASNITLAMMHDIPMATLGKAARVFALYEVAPNKLTKPELDMMSSFMNSGAMLGDFSSAEVKRALNEAWAKNMAMDNDVSLMQRLASFINYEKSKAQALVQAATKLGKKADHFASEAYAAEDNIFRLAAFLTKAGDLQRLDNTKAATPEQLRAAGDFARKAFLDYDIDSKAVRVLRQSVIPFISWGYAVAPVLGRIALHQPWKIANIMMAYYLLDVGMAAMAGDDDEETRKALPESVRERMFFGSFGPNMHIRIPFMGDADNPVYYKLGDYVPFASMTKGLPNGLFGQSWIPSIVTPSGPMVSAVAGFIAGIDPYTGKSLHKPTDTEWDKLINNAKFGYDIVAPPMVTSKNLTKATEIISGDNLSITGVEPSNAVFARMMGLKLYDYNVPEELARQDKIEKAIERDFKAAMNKAKKEEDMRGYPDYDELDDTLEDLQTRMEERVARLRGEEEED